MNAARDDYVRPIDFRQGRVDLTHGALRRMLEWSIEIGHDWNWKPGAYGRGIERELPNDLAHRLAESRDSVERTVALFRLVAHEVGAALGYTYPRRADEAVSAYVEKVSPAQPAGHATKDR